MKSGAGYHELQLENGVYVGAYVAVNACGEVFEDDKILAGVYDYQKQKILSSPELILQGVQREINGINTTIGCVITNAALSKTECHMVSCMAHDGFARAI